MISTQAAWAYYTRAHPLNRIDNTSTDGDEISLEQSLYRQQGVSNARIISADLLHLQFAYMSDLKKRSSADYQKVGQKKCSGMFRTCVCHVGGHLPCQPAVNIHAIARSAIRLRGEGEHVPLLPIQGWVWRAPIACIARQVRHLCDIQSSDKTQVSQRSEASRP